MSKARMQVETEAWNVYNDLTELHKSQITGKTEREDVDSQANVHGKRLKALSIVIADQLRQDGHLSLVNQTKAITG
jgi:hypothetical protein